MVENRAVGLIALAAVLMATQPELVQLPKHDSLAPKLEFLLIKQVLESHKALLDNSLTPPGPSMIRRARMDVPKPKGIEASRLNRHKLLFPETR